MRKFLLIFLSLLLLVLCSCGKEKVDNSDRFVGSDEAFTVPDSPEVIVSRPDSWD